MNNNNPQFLINEASKRGQDIYEVLLDRWGVILDAGAPVYDGNTVSYPDALALPGIPLSLAGIAIGPRSTVDRAWVTYDLQRKPGSTVPLINVTDRVRRLSVDAPIFYTMAGRQGKATFTDPLVPDAFFSQFYDGLLYVFAAATAPVPSATVAYGFDFPDQQETTVLPAVVVKPSGSTQVFGYDANTLERIVFMPPLLHLILYLKTPIIAPPPSRFPLLTSGEITITPAETATEICIAQIPIMGRKHITIDANFGFGFTLRTAIVRAMNQAPSRSIEGSSQTSILAGAGSCSTLIYDHPNGDYLMVYVTVLASEAAIDGQFVVTAYDS